MDISIVQFKRHYVFVCIMTAFSLAGIFTGYREFLLARVFPQADISGVYTISFMLFLACGVMLPQWLLKAFFLTESYKTSDISGRVNTLPTGRADLQPVTLVVSACCLSICFSVILLIFLQPFFSDMRLWLYSKFYLGLNCWLIDALLVFLFTGLIWVQVGFLFAMLYRMVLSLTTQTGIYQTLEQRFYLLTGGGYIAGMFFWLLLAGQLYNTRLLVILSLIPLVLSALWLPIVFSRSTERSFIKHFELKTGVQERSYLSIRSVCLSMFFSGMLTGAYLPLLGHIEDLAGFGWLANAYCQPFMLLLLFCGWYFAFRRDIAGRQNASGVIVPLYRWAGSCLGTIFILALINRQHWCGNSGAILLWYVFFAAGLFFLGDMLFNVRQLIARALPSLSLGWGLWVVMSCLGYIAGDLLFARGLLEIAGSLMVMMTLFFAGVIATGVTIIFTSPQEYWHRRVILFCILPVIISTLVIFWITHNWILKKQGIVIAYCETVANTWAISRYDDNYLWFDLRASQLCMYEQPGPDTWANFLGHILADSPVQNILISGSAIEVVPTLRVNIEKDIIIPAALMARLQKQPQKFFSGH
ncbi:MAG: hypothetical protein JW745_03670, partial [Sedimentisphaerales bacterium]|nr:hypothetical protein [Sedimentisphaerales bacterium]